MYKDYSYHILNPRNCFFPQEVDFRNKLYTSWKMLWDDVYEKVASGYKLASDEFLRQDLLTAILYKNQVAAMHLYSFYHLSSVADLQTKYFHFFSEEYLNKLAEKKVKTVMSMEFLTVLPNFRKSEIGFSIGSTIIQLGTQVFRESGVDSIVAPARNDVGVNKMAYDLGFSCIVKDTEQRGFTCDLIACFQGHQHPSSNDKIRGCAEHLWENRIIYDSAQGLMNKATDAAPRRAA